MNRRCLAGLWTVGLILAIGAVGGLWTLKNAEQEGASRSPERLESIEVAIAETLSRAKVLIDRFDAIGLSQSELPWVLAHAILARGSQVELSAPSLAAPGPLAMDVLLSRARDYVVDTPDGPAFRVAAQRRTYERHPAQFAAYLLIGGAALSGEQGPPNAETYGLREIWESEKRRVHREMDLGWFIPAYCAAAEVAGFENKFAETVDSDYIVEALLEQADRPLLQQACAGGHSLHSLAYARAQLLAELRPALRSKLLQTWNAATSRLLTHASHDDAFDLRGYLQLTTAVDQQWLDDTFLHVIGHAVEAIFVSGDENLEMNPVVHRLVRDLVDRCLSSRIWEQPSHLLTPHPNDRVDYAVVAHLIRGLRLYRERMRSSGYVTN